MADEFHAGICSPMSYWNTMRNPNSNDWSQPFLPVEFSQIQTSFGDHTSAPIQFRDMNDQASYLPGLFEPDLLRDMSEPVQASWSTSNNNLSSHDQLNSRVSLPSKQQLMNFSNDTPFWNPSVNLIEKRLEDESSSSNLITVKPSSSTKKNATEPATKKRRNVTPSPSPTFKVRKEKLGDRITALQQLVSPFGKTDTASVLHEAIDYIKFLHGQVNALSTPYLKSGHQIQHQMQVNSEDGGVQKNQDLRSRGLCLVPISSTFAVATETPMDFWAPTLLGNYDHIYQL